MLTGMSEMLSSSEQMLCSMSPLYRKFCVINTEQD